jgi:hypothetical protein
VIQDVIYNGGEMNTSLAVGSRKESQKERRGEERRGEGRGGEERRGEVSTTQLKCTLSFVAMLTRHYYCCCVGRRVVYMQMYLLFEFPSESVNC